MNGIINLDKPAGISSARAVDRVKRLLPRGTKVGHAGTLDPFATGVLLILVGRATRQCERLMNESKEYETTVRLGATTATDDPESPETPTPDVRAVDAADVERALPAFVGAILQRPPIYSAMKIGGRRAYDVARRGGEVVLAERTVNVYGIDLLSFVWPDLRLRIRCGRGTYIRAIARDLGEKLATGGYLTQLRRTGVGEFTAADAVSLERLAAEGLEPNLRPIDDPASA